jgi:RND family efflux transporter MFP subunit
MPVSIALSDLRLPPRAGVVLVATTLLLAACSRPAPPEEPVRSVKVMTVGAGALDTTREYAGEVKARVESRLGFRVGGKLTQRPAEVGQRVRPGQLLALLDPQDLKLAVDAARAQVVAATTQRDLALADFRRFQSLKDQNFISAAELERREATFKAAQATLDQAQAQLAAQGNQAGYTRLLADVAGVVTAVDAEVGQVVGAGAPVVRVAQDGARDVVFAVPEDRVAALRVGQAVTVRPWSGGATLAGTVRELAASADPVTRTFAVKVALPASDGLPLGATVSVLVQALSGAAPAAAIKLPTSALRQEGQGSAVWLLDTASLTVRSQPVQVLTADGNEAVIGAGLQPGQQVVVAGVHVLSPGQKVTVYQPKSAEPSVERSSSAMKSGASAPSAAASVPAAPAAATSAAR